MNRWLDDWSEGIYDVKWKSWELMYFWVSYFCILTQMSDKSRNESKSRGTLCLRREKSGDEKSNEIILIWDFFFLFNFPLLPFSQIFAMMMISTYIRVWLIVIIWWYFIVCNLCVFRYSEAIVHVVRQWADDNGHKTLWDRMRVFFPAQL